MPWTYASSLTFPDQFIDQFYGLLTNTPSDLRTNITYRHLCNGMMADTGCCSCDEYCMMFKTCCIDYLYEDFAVLYDSPSLERYLHYFINETRLPLYRDTQCVPLVRDLKAGDVTQSILMVTTCPSNSKDVTNTKKCLDPDLTIPVFGSDKYVYKNSYCALCNGMKDFRIVDTIANCKNVQSTSKKENMPKLSTCKFEAKVLPFTDQDFIKECSLRVKTSYCDSSNTSKATRARSYGGIVKSPHFGYFSNIDNLRCKLSTTGASKVNFIVDECPHPFPYIWPWTTSITINYGKVTRVYVDGKLVYIAEKRCPKGFVYNVVSQKCQQFVCAPGYEIEGSACVKSAVVRPTVAETTSRRPDTGELTEEEQLIKCTLRSGNPSLIILLKSKHEHSEVTKILSKIRLSHKNATINGRMISIQNNLTKDNVRRILNITKTSPFIDSIQDVFVRSQPYYYTTFYKYNMATAFSNSRQCSDPKISDFEGEYCSVKSSNRSSDDYVILLEIKQDKTIGYFVTCNKFHHSSACKMNVYENYTLHSNKSVTVDVTEKGNCPCSDRYNTYNSSDYTPLNKGIGICLNEGCVKKNDKSIEAVILTVDFYLGLLGAIVSIISYIFVIVTYSKFRDLRSVPGANIITLCLVLLCADVCSLAVNGLDKNVGACHVIAILLHLFYLMIQSWSTVISFEVWSTFRLAHVKRNMYAYKRFGVYCLYAFLVPTLLVATSVVLDKKDIFSVGYGKAGNNDIRICWMATSLSRIIFYIAPLVIATVFNLSVLSSTIHLIHNQQKISSKLLHKTNPRDGAVARTALKLAMLLGIVEIIGLIQIPGCAKSIVIANAVVRVLFTFLRGFRGLFVLLLYVLFDNRTQELFTATKQKRGSVTMSTYLSSQRGSLASLGRGRLSIKNNNVINSSLNDLVNNTALNVSNDNINVNSNVTIETNGSVDTNV